ncbi:TetR/AcrR family transcriptional regulator [Acidaminobacter sp. JC074]|uniref:TetR/AcrR family transcriptional regulator n=1 Tax=Acidaminobacter sp. JC074 TaxID=2530199 RepID=UPI001F0D1C3B|nr:TetR/AcrR family transcriptional regulator [Acidaminobacter sp. JC074]
MTTDRKAKRIERMRGMIMDAAIQVVSEKGFKHTTTKEIAQVADMAEGTLYNYFKNKDDILMSIAERHIASRRNWQVSTDVESMEEFLLNLYSNQERTQSRETQLKEREVLKALLPLFITDKTLGELYFKRIVKPFLEIVSEKLDILKEKGLVADYNPQALSRLLYASLIGYAVLEINGDPLVTSGDKDFRQDIGEAFIGVFAKGMSQKD